MKLSEETACAALLVNGTAKAAAEALNVDIKTFSALTKKASFKAVYAAARAELLQRVTMDCQNRMVDALEVLSEIMSDKQVGAQTRIQAAQIVLKQGLLMYEATEKAHNDVTAAEREAKDVLNGF